MKLTRQEKFNKLSAIHARAQIHTNCPFRGTHLKLIGNRIVLRRNRIMQAPWQRNVPGMRWAHGKLIPRFSKG